MQFLHATRLAVLIAAPALFIVAQNTAAQSLPVDTKGIPPRATPTDYQSRAQAGDFTIAAEFTGHAMPTLEGPLTTEDYIAVETALFGPAGAKLMISSGHFSLRVNGKKILPSQQYGLLFSSLRDPDWIPPEAPASKSKGGISGGGGGAQGQNEPPPLPPKVPIAEQRAWAKRLQQSALPEGERTLPQAGLVFFQYRGKTANLLSVELIYEGPAGKAVQRLEH